MRRLGFRAMFIAAVIFGMFAALPQALRAESDSYIQAPGEFSQTADAQSGSVGSLASTSVWEVISATNDSTFTGSLLDSHSGPIDEAALEEENSKSLRPEKAAGAKVPEPGTLFLACAGLLGLVRSSNKAKSSTK